MWRGRRRYGLFCTAFGVLSLLIIFRLFFNSLFQIVYDFGEQFAKSFVFQVELPTRLGQRSFFTFRTSSGTERSRVFQHEAEQSGQDGWDGPGGIPLFRMIVTVSKRAPLGRSINMWSLVKHETDLKVLPHAQAKFCVDSKSSVRCENVDSRRHERILHVKAKFAVIKSILVRRILRPFYCVMPVRDRNGKWLNETRSRKGLHDNNADRTYHSSMLDGSGCAVM